MREKLWENRGAAYLWVITLTMLVMILAAMYMALTTTDNRISSSFNDATKAYYLAESGAEKQLAYLYDQIQVKKYDYIPTINSPVVESKPFGPKYPGDQTEIDYSFTTYYVGKIHTVGTNNYSYEFVSKGTYRKATRKITVQVQAEIDPAVSANTKVTKVAQWKTE